MEFNPSIYEGANIVEQDVGSTTPKVPLDNTGVITPISTVLAPLPTYQQGDAERIEASREKVSIATSMKAATSQWATTGIYRTFTDPIFPPDESNPADMILESGITFDNDEMDYVRGAKSARARQFRSSPKLASQLRSMAQVS